MGGGEVKNGEAKELIYMIHVHELRVGGCWREWEYWAEGGKGENKMEQL